MVEHKQSSQFNQPSSSKTKVPFIFKKSVKAVIEESLGPTQVAEHTYQQIGKMVENQMRASALSLVQDLFKEEVESLCGKSNSRKKEGQYHRGGSDPGSILLSGQRVKVKKLRIRRDGEDVELKTHTALQDYDLLCERVMKHMLRGVSTRDYMESLRSQNQMFTFTNFALLRITTAFLSKIMRELTHQNKCLDVYLAYLSVPKLKNGLIFGYNSLNLY